MVKSHEISLVNKIDAANWKFNFNRFNIDRLIRYSTNLILQNKLKFWNMVKSREISLVNKIDAGNGQFNFNCFNIDRLIMYLTNLIL